MLANKRDHSNPKMPLAVNKHKIFHLIYISRSIRIFSEKEILSLLELSRSRNRSRNITGMLLYIQDELLNRDGGRFIQVLEGAELDVRTVFATIREDPRHFNVTVVDEIKKAGRDFATWSMGFEYLEGEQHRIASGSFDLDKGFLTPDRSGKINPPLEFLRSFYSMREGLLRKR